MRRKSDADKACWHAAFKTSNAVLLFFVGKLQHFVIECNLDVSGQGSRVFIRERLVGCGCMGNLRIFALINPSRRVVRRCLEQLHFLMQPVGVVTT